MPKAQVSLEVLVAVTILLFTFILMLVFANTQQQEAEALRAQLLEKNDCVSLQSAISLVNSVPENSRTQTTIFYDANIGKNTISLADYFCTFSGQEITAQLLRGDVLVKKEGGIVSVRNI
ncbi:MAG: hypothetical protein AABW99_03295 [archaeon]